MRRRLAFPATAGLHLPKAAIRICRLRRELVICYVAVLHTVVDITCSTYCLKRFLGIELRQYARVAKYFFLSLLACAPAAVVCALVASPWVSLPVGALSAGLLYWALLRRDENMKECFSVLAGFVRAR